MAQGGIRTVSENFEKNFLNFLGLGTNVVKVSSVNSELLFQSDTLEAWTVCMALNINICRMLTTNRKNRHGGGLVLVHKLTLPVKNTCCRRNKIIPVYKVVKHGNNSHLPSPYSIKYPVTNAMFIDDITEWLLDQLVQSNNVVIAGDFNIQINKQVENDVAGIFMSTSESMGLLIHHSDKHTN